MRRTLLRTVIAASLCVPALSYATRQSGTNVKTVTSPVQQPSMQGRQTINPMESQPGQGSLGGGMQGGDSPGHVTGPGVTQVDNDVNAPINDLQPGRGTEDTRQSKNPKPVR
jgi:hypothetical protein